MKLANAAHRLLGALLLGLLAAQPSALALEEEEKLVGWKGETYVENKWDPLNPKVNNDSVPLPASHGWIELVSWCARGRMQLGEHVVHAAGARRSPQQHALRRATASTASRLKLAAPAYMHKAVAIRTQNLALHCIHPCAR